MLTSANPTKRSYNSLQTEQNVTTIKEEQHSEADFGLISITANEPSSPFSLSHERHSYLIIFALYVVYSTSFSILIPALPSLLLTLTNKNSGRASVLYGLCNFIRYIFEFFSAPVLGSVADAKGRRPVLIASFLVCSLEYFLLSFAPSISMVFITRAISGLFDATSSTAYTIITDIAIHNNDPVSQQYGMLGAMIGLAFIVGPYFGGFISEISLPLCFFLSALLSLMGAFIAYFYLEETKTLRMDSITKQQFHKQASNDFSDVSINPIVGLRIHLSSKRLRQLSFPLFLCTINTGQSFIWYLYMANEFRATATQIGIYLSYHGLINAIAQGVFIKQLIPRFMNEQQATLYTLAIAAVQGIVTALCSRLWQLYAINIFFCSSVLHYATFKSIIVEESMRKANAIVYQANLQGALASINTLATACGALLFPALFSVGLNMRPTRRPSLPYIAAAVLYFLAFICLWLVLDDDSTNKERLQDTVVEIELQGEGSEASSVEAFSEDELKDQKEEILRLIPNVEVDLTRLLEY